MTLRRPLLTALLAAALAGTLAMAPALSGDELPAGGALLQVTGADEDVCDGFEGASFCAGPSDQGGTDDEDGDDGLAEPSGQYEPCETVEGATSITPEEGFDGTVPTPAGAGNFTPAEDAGLHQLDLAGHDVGSTARVRMTLSWDTPALGDYDLIVNGHNELSTDDPETHSRTLQHCDLLDLETVVFIGLPVDTLTLQVTATEVFAPASTVTPTSSPSPSASSEA